MFDIISYIIGKKKGEKTGTVVIEGNDNYTITEDGAGTVTITENISEG